MMRTVQAEIADAVISALDDVEGFNDWWGPLDEQQSTDILDKIAEAVYAVLCDRF